MSSTAVDLARGRERLVAARRSTLLLLGAFAIAWNLTIGLHEFGHLVADRLYGLDAGIVLEPFRSSYTTIADPSSARSAWLDAAGPLTNLTVAALLTAAVWRSARPAVFPLLLMGPLAFLQESTNALVQLATNEPGTDWVRVVDAGLPGWLVWGAGLFVVIAGFIVLIQVVPASGLGPDWTLSRRVAVLGLGFGGYPAAAVLVSVVGGYGLDEVARNSRLLVFILLVAVLLAVFRRQGSSRRAEVDVTSRVVVTTLALAAGLVSGLLLL